MSREWLETNGLGGYASSTIIGMNTRRYHGLLVAADPPPVGRLVLLSKIEETLVIDGIRHELSTNQYPGAIYPQGYLLQTGFRLDPFPVFTYSAGGLSLEKTVFLVHGESTVVVSYELLGSLDGREAALELRPLVAFRDYHSSTHENSNFDATVRQSRGVVWLQPYPALPALYFTHEAGELDTKGSWYRSFEYEAERQRGLDFVEDLYQPFTLTCRLAPGIPVSVIASTSSQSPAPPATLRDGERARRGPVQDSPSLAGALTRAADQFLVRRDGFYTVIAGYHWFGDWGRDTMIALPGLTLATGRDELARKLLLVFAANMRDGLIPNRFTETGAAEYNTIDATLWYIEAVRAYIAATRDSGFVRQNLYAALRESIAWLERGTRFGIHVDSDGLLEGGDEGVQLTWMDAKVGDFVVTPRCGKPVEVQALWYNAVRVLESLANTYGDLQGAAHYQQIAARARDSFCKAFWNDHERCLYDVIQGEHRDGSIRPNQVLALSLEYCMLDAEAGRAVLERVEKDLLTPFGLRSLSPLDPRYRGRYESDLRSRDTAYHQGTVWPWLIGPFFRAWRRVYGDTAETRAVIADWLKNFQGHLQEAGLGQVSEIFDGDPPHAPRGCIAQAWSVAEVLRLALGH